jgi:hypothetical protein
MESSSVLPSEGRYWVIAPQGFLQTFLRENASREMDRVWWFMHRELDLILSCQRIQKSVSCSDWVSGRSD